MNVSRFSLHHLYTYSEENLLQTSDDTFLVLIKVALKLNLAVLYSSFTLDVSKSLYLVTQKALHSLKLLYLWCTVRHPLFLIVQDKLQLLLKC